VRVWCEGLVAHTQSTHVHTQRGVSITASLCGPWAASAQVVQLMLILVSSSTITTAFCCGCYMHYDSLLLHVRGVFVGLHDVCKPH
jgi:hypothetical protein